MTKPWKVLVGSRFDIRGGNLRIIFILNVKKKKKNKQNCTEPGFSFVLFYFVF